MFIAIKSMFGFEKEIDGQSAIMDRLRQQKVENESENAKVNEGLDVFGHKNKGVLLSQQNSSNNEQRSRWPQMKSSSKSTINTSAEGNGFWDRALSARKETIRKRQQLLKAIESR